MKNASEIFNDLPDGSRFVDGTVLDSLQPLVETKTNGGIKMMEEGKPYKRVDGGQFSFGEKTGTFIGYADNTWQRFKLSGKRQCAINATDDSFQIIEPPTTSRIPIGDIYS